MIDSGTGMMRGERYVVHNLERTHNFGGFFLDGKYYLGPELMTAVGWLEGQQFLYDELDAMGEPVFPDRVAGIIENLTLVLNDGARLELEAVQVHVPNAQPERASVARPVSGQLHGKTVVITGASAESGARPRMPSPSKEHAWYLQPGTLPRWPKSSRNVPCAAPRRLPSRPTSPNPTR